VTDPETYSTRPDVVAALDEYATMCLDLIQNRSVTDALPDVAEYLRGQGVEEPPEGAIHIQHTVNAVDVKPLKQLCPDGSDGCISKCKPIRGEIHCVWICRC
jgi:hypothetical protein